EAAAYLGIKRETLYAYASRGLVRSIASAASRARRYVRADLDRLKVRRDARAGHGPVAAGALSWGEPVLASAITDIRAAGPRYRGHDAIAMARSGVGFESVAELLWTGDLPEAPLHWPTHDLGVSLAKLAPLLPESAREATSSPAAWAPLPTLGLVVQALAVRDGARYGAPAAAELERARILLPTIAALVGAPRQTGRALRAVRAGTVARALSIALGARGGREAERAIDAALVLSADHELNPSSFASRIAASVGADLYACVSAGIATLSGPLHGAACDRIEALV